MSNSPSSPDLWRLPAFLLWVLLFLIGLVPDEVFRLFRELGHVKTQSALVNSHYLITFCLAGFLGHFTYQRSVDAGTDDLSARGKGLQSAVFGLVAFLPVPWELLPALHDIPKLELRLAVLFACSAKFGAWVYLLSVLVRYYFWSGQAVYQGMSSVLRGSHTVVHSEAVKWPVQDAVKRDNQSDGQVSTMCGELRIHDPEQDRSSQEDDY